MKKIRLLFLTLFISVTYTTVVVGQIQHNPDWVVFYNGPDLQLNSGTGTCGAGCLPKPGSCTAYRYFYDNTPTYSESFTCDFIGVKVVKEQRILRDANSGGPTGCTVTESVVSQDQFTVTSVNFAWTSTPPAACPNGNSITLADYFTAPSNTVFTGTGVIAGMFYPNIAGPGNHVITAVRNFSNGTATRTVTIKVNGVALINTQPVSKTVCPGSFNLSVVATAANPPLSYQWQSSPNGTTWTDITNTGIYSGATTTSLSFNGATSSLEGYRYRVIVKDGCGASSQIISNAATLNFNTPVSYSVQPLDKSACEGATATFNALAIGTGVGYQWQASNNGLNWIDLAEDLTYSGTKTTTLNVLSSISVNNLQYRVVATGTCGAYNSNTARLTVTTGPTITTSPAPVIACEGSSASFTVAASGSSLTYQWQYSSSGGTGTFADISGATSSSYTRTSLIQSSAGFYRAMVKSSCGSTGVASGSAQLIINAMARITVPPEDDQVCVGGTIQFPVEGEGYGTLSYQWEVSTNGGTSYATIANSALYSGVTTTTLRITGATAAINKYRYRVRITGACGTSPSAGATLTVNAYPVLPTVSNPSRCGSGVLAATATSSATSPTFRWYTNATDITPVYTGSTYSISNLTATTSFHVSVMSAGCESNKTSMTFTRHAQQSVPLGAPLMLCSGQGIYNLENDIQSQEAKGSNFTYTANSTNFTSKDFDPAVGPGNYVVSYNPPASAQAAPYCFIPTTRTVNVIYTASGDGGIQFVHPSIYNGSVMNMCIGDSPIDLTSLPSIPGGSWSVISGTGLSYSANAVIFTPNQNSYTSIEPNVFRYTLQVNGCTVTKELRIFVKDNQSVPVISGIPGVVCPGQKLNLVASVVTPGTFAFNWYKAGESTPFATIGTLSYPVTSQESLQVRSINGSFGCLSAAKAVDIFTPFSSGTVLVDKRNVTTGDFVSFSTDASESGNTFVWDFADGATSVERSPTHFYYAPGAYKVTLSINSNLGCSQTISYESITVEGEPVNVVTGDETIIQPGVFVFPNPVKDHLSVQCEEVVQSCTLTDYQGQPANTVRTGEDKHFTLATDHLRSGVYVLHLVTKSRTVHVKVIKR